DEALAGRAVKVDGRAVHKSKGAPAVRQLNIVDGDVQAGPVKEHAVGEENGDLSSGVHRVVQSDITLGGQEHSPAHILLPGDRRGDGASRAGSENTLVNVGFAVRQVHPSLAETGLRQSVHIVSIPKVTA